MNRILLTAICGVLIVQRSFTQPFFSPLPSFSANNFTSAFGPRDYNGNVGTDEQQDYPLDNYKYDFHAAFDMGTSINSIVVPVANGFPDIYEDQAGPLGNYVVVKHWRADGTYFMVRYRHVDPSILFMEMRENPIAWIGGNPYPRYLAGGEDLLGTTMLSHLDIRYFPAGFIEDLHANLDMNADNPGPILTAVGGNLFSEATPVLHDWEGSSLNPQLPIPIRYDSNTEFWNPPNAPYFEFQVGISKLALSIRSVYVYLSGYDNTTNHGTRDLLRGGNSLNSPEGANVGVVHYYADYINGQFPHNWRVACGDLNQGGDDHGHRSNSIGIYPTVLSPSSTDHIVRFRWYINQDMWLKMVQAVTVRIGVDTWLPATSRLTDPITVSACDFCVPKPTGLSLIPSGNDIIVGWNMRPDGSHVTYIVVYKDGAPVSPSLLPNATSYTHVGGASSAQSMYDVRFFYNNGSAVFENRSNTRQFMRAENVGDSKTWDGTVLVGSSVSVSSGATLTVTPTTNVYFAGSYTSLTVNGKITVAGEPSSRVTFAPTGSNWYGILLNGAGASNSSISYATISNVQTYGGAALVVNGANNVTIDHCKIINNINYGTAGIGLYNAGSPKISYSIIANNGSEGIRCQNTSGYFWADSITGGVNLFNSSPAFGHDGFPAYYGNNEITGGNYGIYASSYSYPFVGSQFSSFYSYNSIHDNSTARVCATSGSEVFAEQTWWGSPTPSSSLFQTSGNSHIYWSPWLTSPPPVPQRSILQSPGSSPASFSPPQKSIAVADGGAGTETVSIWDVRKAAVSGQPDLAVTLLSSFYGSAKDEEAKERALAELVILTQNYPDKGNVRDLASIFLSKSYSSAHARLNAARLYSLSGNKSKALELRTGVMADRANVVDYKLAALDGVFEDLALGNLSNARKVLAVLQKAYPEDAEVGQATWLLQRLSGDGAVKTSPDIASEDDAQKDIFAAYPNPFNPVSEIHFTLTSTARVSLKVYDVLGREVATLADGMMDAGTHASRFDAGRLSSGMYICRLLAIAEDGKTTDIARKLVLAK